MTRTCGLTQLRTLWKSARSASGHQNGCPSRSIADTPLSGNKLDGKSRSFDIVAGTNFAEGNGNAAQQLFTQVFVMTNGGPDGATSTVTFHMVQKGFREQDIAYASTIAVIFFLIIVAISMIQRFALRTREA